MGRVARGVCGTTGVPMSRYGYDFAPTPTPNRWRSVFRNILVIGTVAGISAISGAVVALDLLGSGSAATERPAAIARQTPPASLFVARIVTPTPSQPAGVATNAGTAAVQWPQPTAAPASPAVQSPAASAPQAAQAPQPAPAAAAVTVEEPKTVKVPENELTFTHGYARRRAVQEAATAGPGANTDMARVESQTQIGRAASKAKPRTTVARQNRPQDQSGAYARAEQPNRFDFSRHQALAFGDPRGERRPPPQSGGLFGGGFFRGLF
jgi:hypothetical protein